MFQKIQKGNKIRSIRQWEELVLDRKRSSILTTGKDCKINLDVHIFMN